MQGKMRFGKRLAISVAVAASAATMAACGSSDVEGTLSQEEAAALNSELDAVSAAAARGDCTTAESGASQFIAAVDQLPASAGTELKGALREAGNHLLELTDDTSVCQPTEAPTRTREQSTTSTVPPETTTTSPTTTTTSTTTTTPSTTTEEQPTTTTGGDNVNGGGAQGGEGPEDGTGGGGTGGTGGEG